MADRHDPAADPAAMVTVGGARFAVLTSRLIRLEWSPAGTFVDRASQFVVNRRLPVPTFDVRGSGNATLIETEHLQLEYRDDGQRFNAKNLRIESRGCVPSFLWTPALSNRGNLGGTARTLDETKGTIELEPGILSRDGWAIVDDSTRLVFDSWPDGWVAPRAHSQAIDWYYFGYGHEYRQALRDFTCIAGRIPIPPRYVLGPWWSRYWAYSDAELRELVGQFREHGVPLDVLVIDMDWHLEGWTGYTWNQHYFPDPEKFIQWAHAEGLRVTLNLHPADGVQSHEATFEQFAREIGANPKDTSHIPFDCTDPDFIKSYFSILHHPIERQGIDFWWMDWQQGTETGIPGLDPLWWLNHLHWRDMEKSPDRGDARPLIFSRWGGLGNHRYPIGFSGDTYSTWEALAFQPKFTATAGNVGYGWWSHDIGGHFYGPVDCELYLRWIQFGAISPVLRTHTSKNTDAERRIWEFPKHFELMREAFRFRIRLAPYLYTAARQAYEAGVSLCRPIYYDWPNYEQAYKFDGQYMLGDSLLCAPVTKRVDPKTGTSRVTVWLPPGQWMRWHTKDLFGGDQVVELHVPLDEIPMFLRSGNGVTLGPDAPTAAPPCADPLTCIIFPGDRGTVTLYEDDGVSDAYQRGAYQKWTMEWMQIDRSLLISMKPAAGDGYDGLIGRRQLELHVWCHDAVERVLFDLKEVAAGEQARRAFWEPMEDGGARIVLPKIDTRHKHEVVVHT